MRERISSEIDELRIRSSNALRPKQDVIDEKARELYDHYYGTIEAMKMNKHLDDTLRYKNPANQEVMEQGMRRWEEILIHDTEELRKLGLPAPDDLSLEEYRRLFPGGDIPPHLQD